MSAYDHLPAHLVPCHPLTIGTPPSPETAVDWPQCPAAAHRFHNGTCLRCGVTGPQPAPIVTIRQAGPHGSELYVRTGDGSQILTIPLTYGLLINLLEDATAGLRRCEETR